jgi:putative transposase
MKAQTMKAKMEELGVLGSYSRPRVSDDNPYSEALFRTLKYRPEWPSSGFASLEVARNWVQQFADWYNTKHRHSKINFVTPSQRHRGEDKDILEGRELVLEKAKEMSPLRWSGDIRNCQPAGPVSLNPEKESIKTNRKKSHNKIWVKSATYIEKHRGFQYAGLTCYVIFM